MRRRLPPSARLATLLVVAAGTVAAACVPASEAAPPAGAAGFIVEPSAAARGEPFVTVDGWTVRFDQLVLSADVTAISSARSYGRSAQWLIDASRRIDLYAPGVDVGPTKVELELRGDFIVLDPRGGVIESRRRIVDIDPAIAARFRRAPDEGFEEGAAGGPLGYGTGPSILVVVRAEKAGRVVRLDLALGTFSYGSASSPGAPTVEVRENDLALGQLRVAPENLFTAGAARSFDAFAYADADRDGLLTVAELRAERIDCNPCTAETTESTRSTRYGIDLVELLEERVPTIIVGRR